MEELELEGKSQKQVFFGIDTRKKEHLNQDIMQIVVETKIGEELQDRVVNNARLLSNGFDDNIQKSGRIGMKDDSHPDKFDVPSEVSWKMKIPDTIASSPFFTVKLFEKPLGSILDAIESLIRNPSGCFEQTSSTTYPMIMAL